MPAHVLPTLLKIGEYTLNKENHTLQHKNQRKDSSGRKCRFEYTCDVCATVYETRLIVEMERMFPWLCRSCATKECWKLDTYRISHKASDETRHKHRLNRCRRNKCPIFRKQLSISLRNRDPRWVSLAKRSIKQSVVLFHWKTNDEIICTGSYERAFVEWANKHQIDFDWQIPHKMPNGRTYIVDAFIKTGDFSGTWIEIKGWMSEIGREKWEWFHSCYPNISQLWNRERLLQLGILDANHKKTKCGTTTCV